MLGRLPSFYKGQSSLPNGVLQSGCRAWKLARRRGRNRHKSSDSVERPERTQVRGQGGQVAKRQHRMQKKPAEGAAVCSQGGIRHWASHCGALNPLPRTAYRLLRLTRAAANDGVVQIESGGDLSVAIKQRMISVLFREATADALHMEILVEDIVLKTAVVRAVPVR